MSEQINRETRLPYARFNGSIVTGDAVSSRGAKWVRVWIYLLNRKDREGAELVRGRNLRRDSDNDEYSKGS